jgi:hypothetical protein
VPLASCSLTLDGHSQPQAGQIHRGGVVMCWGDRLRRQVLTDTVRDCVSLGPEVGALDVDGPLWGRG